MRRSTAALLHGSAALLLAAQASAAEKVSITRDDFDYAELADKGGLQKAWKLFGKELDVLMDEMNRELVA